MARYIWRDGNWVEAHLAPPREVLRSHLASPRVQADTMEPIRSMADGRMYDSRSSYYADLKARGYEIVGDETPAHHKPAPEFQPITEDEVVEAYDQCVAGKGATDKDEVEAPVENFTLDEATLNIEADST